MNISPLPQVKASSDPFTGSRSLLAIVIGVGVASSIVLGQDSGANKMVIPPKDLLTTALPSEAVITAARERAKLLHDVYSTTLDVMHHRYFRQDGPVLPARAMEDVFDEMAGLSGSTANWIAVNTKAMSINHEPRTEFEKKAASELASGKDDYEHVGKRVYQLAAAIPLRNSCVGCHTKMFSDPPKSPRFAGLVISIPLKLEKK